MDNIHPIAFWGAIAAVIAAVTGIVSLGLNICWRRAKITVKILPKFRDNQITHIVIRLVDRSNKASYKSLFVRVNGWVFSIARTFH